MHFCFTVFEEIPPSPKLNMHTLRERKSTYKNQRKDSGIQVQNILFKISIHNILTYDGGSFQELSTTFNK